MEVIIISPTLKRASVSRPSGQWSDNDFDVLADGNRRSHQRGVQKLSIDRMEHSELIWLSGSSISPSLRHACAAPVRESGRVDYTEWEKRPCCN
jgi:hypothetical protein